MKKGIILFLSLCFLFAGCDSGLEIVGMEIHIYPDKLVYEAGVDTELDLTGGKVNFIFRQGGGYEASIFCDSITVTHDIDFNEPGIYVVTLSRHRGVTQFEIEVVNLEDLP